MTKRDHARGKNPLVERRRDFHQSLFATFSTAVDGIGREPEEAGGLVSGALHHVGVD
jgi:hypothetical protein